MSLNLPLAQITVTNDVTNKLMVGKVEVCNLPDLNINNLTVRIDTGAKTSSLHVDNIVEFKKLDKRWVSFDIHPDVHNVKTIVRREARVKALRKIKSSNGTTERRYVIRTLLEMGGHQWKVQLTLTDRSSMTYLMLLGREAMAGRITVDPEYEYLLGKGS